jgi:hypothetical protein
MLTDIPLCLKRTKGSPAGIQSMGTSDMNVLSRIRGGVGNLPSSSYRRNCDPCGSHHQENRGNEGDRDRRGIDVRVAMNQEHA